MSAHAARLSRLFTSEYARRINSQVVHPLQSVVVKPKELELALYQPLNHSIRDLQKPSYTLAAAMSYSIIKCMLHCFAEDA